MNKKLMFIQIILLLFIVGCTNPSASSPYPIVDSGMWAAFPVDEPSIAWLDNQRIIFVGKKAANPSEPLNLFIWDLKKRDITLYKQGVESLCYNQGILMYFTGFARERKAYRGKLGEEQPVALGRLIDWINCRILAENPGTSIGRSWMPLLDEHGYLDLGPSRKIKLEGLILFYKKEEEQPITMPFGLDQIYSNLSRSGLKIVS